MDQNDAIRTSAEAAENAVLPRMYVRLAEGEAGEDVALPEAVARRPVAQKSAAEWAYERLILYIQNFEEQLDNAHEVAMGFAGSNSGVIRIEGIGYFDPDIVTFYGSDEAGTKTQLIQHVTQLSVTLRALPKQSTDGSARRIGFRLAQDLDRG
ncbi:MAG: DUF6173 family protein [Pseudomonadota bacterium]